MAPYGRPTSTRRAALACALLPCACPEEENPMPGGTTGDCPLFSALYGPGIGTGEMEVDRATPSGVFVGGFTAGFADEDGDGWVVGIDASGKLVSQGTLGGKGADMILDRVVLDHGGIAGTGDAGRGGRRLR